MKGRKRAVTEAEQWARWHKHIDKMLANIEAVPTDPQQHLKADALICSVFRSMGWGDIANRLGKLQGW